MEPTAASANLLHRKAGSTQCHDKNVGQEPFSEVTAEKVNKSASYRTNSDPAAVSSVGAVHEATGPQMSSESGNAEVELFHDPEEKKKCWKKFAARFRPPSPSLVSFLISLLSISCWALAGNASRISLSAAFKNHSFFYPSFSYFGPNAFGCMAMGFFQSSLWPSEDKLPWLTRGLCVGFCGCFTTLSSWMIDIANASSVAAAAEDLICGLSIPFVFYLWGADFGKGLHHCVCSMQKKKKASPRRSSNPIISVSVHVDEQPDEPSTSLFQTPCTCWWVDVCVLLVVTIAAITIPTALYCVQHYHRPPGGLVGSMSTSDLRTTMLAPVGAVPRFLLCYTLNKQLVWHSFPVGTFCSNVIAVIIAMILYREEYFNASTRQSSTITDTASASLQKNVCESWACSAVITGICGALSTVSSFVSEVIGFYREGRVSMAYAYLCSTVAVALLIAAVGRQNNFR